MKRRILIAFGATGLIAMIGAFTPLALRQMPFFRVRQVELMGVRHHSPERLLRALDIAADRNLFESLEDIEARAAALPGVVGARVKRRMPGTLTIEVEERVPVAFVPMSTGLLALDAEARPLTYDPTETGLDLPMVQAADSVLARVLATVWFADSALYEDVDAARLGGDDEVILDLGETEVILRREPTFDEIRAVDLVRRHLTATGRRYEELDARFEGRVLVRGSAA